ncbi:MAG: hypothetical protein R3F61_28775 [Myxococcota bacterium]
MTLTVFGAGELGGRIAARWKGPVRAVTKTVRRHAELAAHGASPTLDWPALTPDDLAVLALSGSASQLEAIERLAHGPVPRRVLLVSTTGFHRPYEGTVRPTDPPGSEPRAQAAARTEQAFREWAGDRGVILRCAGLWHATRGPGAAFARSRTAPPGAPDAPIPLVHYDDAATLAVAALLVPSPPVLLAVTATPSREAFYAAAAAVVGCDPPVFTAPTGDIVAFEDPTAVALMGDPEHRDWRSGVQGVR